MKKQTFIVHHWCGGYNTYREAVKNGAKHDFNRVGCKRVGTAMSYLKNWVKQANDPTWGWNFLYPTLRDEDARYEIIATPNGYDGDEVVACGWIKDLKEG